MHNQGSVCHQYRSFPPGSVVVDYGNAFACVKLGVVSFTCVYYEQ
jgi:hypothetical protein